MTCEMVICILNGLAMTILFWHRRRCQFSIRGNNIVCRSFNRLRTLHVRSIYLKFRVFDLKLTKDISM